MNELIYAIFLGIVQGIAEFLPISSSAHLVLASWVATGKPMSLTLNVALHAGTMAAVLVYFRKDWMDLSLVVLKPKSRDAKKARLLLGIIVGSIPAAILGLSLKDWIAEHLHHPFVVSGPLVIVGIALWWVDKKKPQANNIDNIRTRDALFIGLAQASALLPGVSRSGATILAARWLCFDRDSAARFSFLLGTPVMVGATLLQFSDILESLDKPEFYVGILASFLTGIVSIGFFLKFIKKFGFGAFAIYRTLLAIAIVAMMIAKATS